MAMVKQSGKQGGLHVRLYRDRRRNCGCCQCEKACRGSRKESTGLERRSHIGGNCYDEPDEHGILIHNYGPHIFHTGIEEVYQYLSRFTDWYVFGHEVVAKVGDRLIPVPFNLNTLHMVYEKEKQMH